MREVRISHDKPEIYQTLHSRFGADWDEGVIIAWNGQVHCAGTPSPEKIVHEMKHLDRQEEMGNEAWWRAYIDDPQFRLHEEKLAYKAEADFVRKAGEKRPGHKAIPRNAVFYTIMDIAEAFANGPYGGIITKQDALDFLYA